ncbi:MAG: serine/threonine-protein kinase [Gemmatimonadaceae bacterium]|nr:serine/threonine-protein kinase [Gemmatimonadaceae bacterium]
MEDLAATLQASLGDRYSVVRELGRGGMATVFLAEDVKIGRKVAIKVLHPELSASMGADRFLREISVAGRLQHPHILGLFDSGQAGALLYYVMPFVEGESLRDKLDREGQLSIEEAIQITLEVCDALGHAHAQGIIHRDIKPENILLSNGHALVADFGIARALSEGGPARLTQTGIALGTPVYMSPEQSMADTLTPAADIYSLGCVLYEMLAGEPPFTGKSMHAIMARHAMEAVPSVRVIRATVPVEVEEAIFAAMAKTPVDRPKTASDFAALLAIPVDGTTSSTSALRSPAVRRATLGRGFTAAAPARTATPLWKRPAVLASALAGVATLAGGVWWFTKSSGPAAPSGPPPDQIAVLYFDDKSPNGALAYVADGLTESVIRALNGVQGLGVVSPGGVAPYRATTVSSDSISRALKAGTLVRGSIAPNGDQLDIRIRLEDATGEEVGSTSLTLPALALVQIRDSVAQAVATSIRSVVGREITVRRQRLTTRSDRAWGLYQQGDQRRRVADAAARAGDTDAASAAFAMADSLLAGAEAADRDWPAPLVGRALVSYGRSRVPGLEALAMRPLVAEGVERVNRALALDSLNADAYEVRGNLVYWAWLRKTSSDAAERDQQLKSARADFERATQIEPKQSGAWASLAHLYFNTPDKRLPDVARAATAAYEADAYNERAEVTLSRLFTVTYDLEQWVDADRWCGEMRRRFPSSLIAPRCELRLLTSKARQPDVTRAWRLADSVVLLAPKALQPFERLSSNTYVAAVLAMTGKADSARHVLERSLNPDIDKTRDLWQNAAFVYVLLGDKAAAVSALSTYLQANEQRRAVFFVEPSWWYRPLFGTPEYERLKPKTD